MVAVSDFSGLASSICALASAPAIAPMVSLQRCMTNLHLHEVKTDRTRFRALGADAMPDRLFGVVRHQLLQLGLGGVMLNISCARLAKHASQFRPGIRCAHVDDTHCLDFRMRRLDAEHMRGLASLDAAPELPLGRE